MTTNEIKKATRGRANAADAHVGARVRERRVMLGMSQEKLGEAVTLTFQQIQKYERGSNRISASRLWQFSEVLGVKPEYFFEGLERIDAPLGSKAPDHDLLVRRETLEMVRNYYKIPAAERAALYKLINRMARRSRAPANA
jgi:transcriptional regulator with XRE-family HTH domain